MNQDTDVIETLQRAHTGRADSVQRAVVGQEVFNVLPTHGNPFCMHRVTFNLLALHGFESSRSYMQRNLFAHNTGLIQTPKNVIGKMESGRRCSHGAFNFRIDRLVIVEIALLRLAI